MEDEFDEALNASVNEDRKPMRKQSMTDRSVEGIETTINNLTAKRMELEDAILELEDQRRHVVRSLNAFRTALIRLQP